MIFLFRYKSQPQLGNLFVLQKFDKFNLPKNLRNIFLHIRNSIIVLNIFDHGKVCCNSTITKLKSIQLFSFNSWQLKLRQYMEDDGRR